MNTKASTTMPASAPEAGTSFQVETAPTPREVAQQAKADSAKPATEAQKLAEKAAAQAAKAAEAEAKAKAAAELAERTAEWLQAAATWQHGEVLATGAATNEALSSFETTMASFAATLGTVLENKYYLQLGYTKFADYASATLVEVFGDTPPQGAIRNSLVKVIASLIPGAGPTAIAEIVRSNKATVSRVLNGSDTGSGENGHGGARAARPEKTSDSDKLAKSLESYVGLITNHERVATVDLLKILRKLEGAVLVVKAEADKRQRPTSGAQGNQSRTGTVAA